MTDIVRITRTPPMRPVKPKNSHRQGEQSKNKQQKPDVSKEDKSGNDNKKHIDEHV